LARYSSLSCSTQKGKQHEQIVAIFIQTEHNKAVKLSAQDHQMLVVEFATSKPLLHGTG
jgi:hypothetical protein